MAITTLRSTFCGPRLAARPACLSLAVFLAFAGAGARERLGARDAQPFFMSRFTSTLCA
ncbi:hypothetical protein VSR34_13925 [Paraburkholderia sp. JHI2823]|uniref:hypothetical protein n=1 Tax=Paraburkholderia TaxID=1822464 RepID=UPI0012DEC0F4|nr:hypothetical protein [Paraburkholderia mimosarum]